MASVLLGETNPAKAADSAEPDYSWYREAEAERFEQQTQPPAEITSVTLDGNILSAHVHVQPWATENSIGFVMAAPAGDITSTSLLAQTFFERRETMSMSAAPDDANTSAARAPREHTATVTHLGFIRGHRLVRVQIPAIVSGTFGNRFESGELKISLALDKDKQKAKPGSTAGGPIDNMLQKFVANPNDLGRFALSMADVPGPVTKNPDLPLGPAGKAVARFETTDSGFIRFTGADLARCGVNLSGLPKSNVSVWSNGEQQPVLVDSSTTSTGANVKPDDQFTLYTRENPSTYTLSRVYWIKTDQAARLMKQSTATPDPATVTAADQHFNSHTVIEKDLPPVLTKNDQFLSILDYRWVWWTWTPAGASANLPSPRSYNKPGQFTFDLPGKSNAATATSTLTFNFYAHHWQKDTHPLPINVSLNGQNIGTVRVSDPETLSPTLNIASSSLKTARNQVILTPEMTTSTTAMPDLCFDSLELTYPHSYQMTSATLDIHPPAENGGVVAIQTGQNADQVLLADISTFAPEVLHPVPTANKSALLVNTTGPADRPYVIVERDSIRHAALTPVKSENDLRSTANTADMIVIAWPAFIPELKPWVDRKAAAGHTVKVVSIADVYDQFGYGHASPHAIRSFLRYASIHWQGTSAGPAASSVLLVGDSTSAYRNEFKNDVINYVPTIRLQVNGDTFASDQWYVSLFGDDYLADALIGRFSVNSIEDLHNVIQKQLNYEQNAAPSAWNNTLGFIADHSEFESSINRVMDQVVPPRFFLDRIMMSELPWIDNYYFPRAIADAQQAKVSPAATNRIRDMFNRGAAVVTYFGHGSPNIWSTERMWFGGDSPNSDNLLLSNRDRLSIVINMTCNSGAIDYPQPRWNVCISEDFMRVPNGGAVACFVPSGPGLTVQHERLMLEVGKCLFGPDQQTLGESAQLGLWRYLAAGNSPELARMYILLGDPLLMPHISKPLPATIAETPPDTQWPGTVLLPRDVRSAKTGGNYQVNTYKKEIDTGPIGSFTTATVAMPLPMDSSDAAQVLALSVPAPGSTETLSTFLPLSAERAVSLLQWRRTARTGSSTTTTTLDIRLRNSSPLPIAPFHIEIQDDTDKHVAGNSADVTLQPFADANIPVTIPYATGLKTYRAFLVNDTTRHPLESDVPIAVAGVRPDDMRTSIPPAVVDKRSLSVRYRKAGNTAGGASATITAWVYALAREPLSNLRVGIEGPDGVVIEKSIVSVPSMAPGENAQVTMNIDIPDNTERADYTIRFDPAGYYPEFKRFPQEEITLGRSHFSDVVITSVTPTNPHPTDGQTVFFNVVVANHGRSRVDGIRVEATETTGGKTSKLTSQVMLEPPMFSLEPGASKEIQLRWDPFQNAGINNLQFRAHSVYEMPDIYPDNNTANLALKVNSKAVLRSVKAGVLRPTADDKRNQQVRFLARVRNDGQTEIHGLRVVFYSSKDMKDEDFLGEEELDSVAPGETKDVILTYKVKPEEVDRPIHVTFEVMYKGSRQRLLN